MEVLRRVLTTAKSFSLYWIFPSPVPCLLESKLKVQVENVCARYEKSFYCNLNYVWMEIKLERSLGNVHVNSRNWTDTEREKENVKVQDKLYYIILYIENKDWKSTIEERADSERNEELNFKRYALIEVRDPAVRLRFLFLSYIFYTKSTFLAQFSIIILSCVLLHINSIITANLWSMR